MKHVLKNIKTCGHVVFHNYPIAEDNNGTPRKELRVVNRYNEVNIYYSLITLEMPRG